MIYIIALLLPPLGVLLVGRPFVAIVMAVIWLLSLPFTLGGSHLLFVLLAWLIIAQTRSDRRVDRLIRATRNRRDQGE